MRNHTERWHREAGNSQMAVITVVALAIAGISLAVAIAMLTGGSDEPDANGTPGDEPTTKAVVRPLPRDMAANASGEPYIAPAGRSPLPQPGESFDQPIPAKKLADVVAPKSDRPTPTEPIDWTEAKLYVGHEITVVGKVVATANIGSICFLNFTDEPKGGDKFYVVVFKEIFDAYNGKPEDHFRGKMIEVRGKVTLHKGRPQIQVRNTERIKVTGP